MTPFCAEKPSRLWPWEGASRKFRFPIASALVLVTACLVTGCANMGEPAVSVGIRAIYEKRNTGYFQTPRGGKSFATSERRPTWEEADMESELKGRLDINIDTKHFRAKVLYGPSHQESSGIIVRKTLVSAGAIFLTGEVMNFEYKNDEHQFMFYPKILEMSWLDDRVTLSPFVGMYYYDKRMIVSNYIMASERSRGRTAPTVGIDGQWTLTDFDHVRFSVFGSYLSALQEGHQAEIGVRLEWDVEKWTLLGEAMWFDYLERDLQDTPNEDSRSGWRFSLGVMYRF